MVPWHEIPLGRTAECITAGRLGIPQSSSDESSLSFPQKDRAPQPVRKFGVFTDDLHILADWRQKCGVWTVTMESTSVSWIPL